MTNILSDIKLIDVKLLRLNHLPSPTLLPFLKEIFKVINAILLRKKNNYFFKKDNIGIKTKLDTTVNTK